MGITRIKDSKHNNNKTRNGRICKYYQKIKRNTEVTRSYTNYSNKLQNTDRPLTNYWPFTLDHPYFKIPIPEKYTIYAKYLNSSTLIVLPYDCYLKYYYLILLTTALLTKSLKLLVLYQRQVSYYQ